MVDQREEVGATRAARAAIAGLPSDEDKLYRLLALQMKAIERDPWKAGDARIKVDEVEALGVGFIDLVAFGKQAFGRLAMAGHSLVCGTETDQGFRLERLLATAGKDVTAVTATVAALLVGQLAVAPAVAGIVATIVVGKVAPSSLEALCKAWGAKIPPPATPPGQPPGPAGPQTEQPLPPPPPPPGTT